MTEWSRLESWFIASELVRRHPALRLIETHPHHGNHDCLTLVDVSGSQPISIIDLARSKFIWVRCAPNQALAHIQWLDTITVQANTGTDDRHYIVKKIEEVGRLTAPSVTPPSAPTTLTYRVVARVLAALVNEKARWDVRNEFLDTSADMADSRRRHWTDDFPSAAEAVEQRRPNDLLGIAAYRYWALLKEGEPMAILDTDGIVHLPDATHSLSEMYRASNRSLTGTIASALGPVLP